MREKEIESWAKRKAREAGWYVRKFTSPGNRSVPDDIFIRNARVWFCEFKATGNKPTPLQLEEHRLLIAAGATVYVCDSREQFTDILASEEASLAGNRRPYYAD